MSVPTHPRRLFDFAAQGKAEELRQLLADGTIGSIKVLDSKGRTALNIAVSEEHLNVIQARTLPFLRGQRIRTRKLDGSWPALPTLTLLSCPAGPASPRSFVPGPS